MENRNMPMYQIIERDLRVSILEGKLKQGDMIPSETELSARYKVTRMTVRQAINNLLVDGYIYRHKGKGTFVTFNKMEIDQESKTPFFSFTKEMIGINAPVVTTVIQFTSIAADEIVAQRLQLSLGDEIYYVERIRQSGNIPLVYDRLYLPKCLFGELTEDVFIGSFHDYVQNVLNFRIRNCESAIEARAVSPKVAELLHQTTGEPALYMSSTTYLENGRAFMYQRQYFHGNHFRFKHNFKK